MQPGLGYCWGIPAFRVPKASPPPHMGRALVGPGVTPSRLHKPVTDIWGGHQDGRSPAPSVCEPGSSGADREAPGRSAWDPCQPQRRWGSSWPSASKMPLTFPQQMFAFSVCWSDDSDSFIRRSWEDFRRLHVSKPGHPTSPSSLTHLKPPLACPCAHLGFQPRDPCLLSQGNLVGPRRPMMPLLTLRKPSRRPSQWRRACCGDLTAFSPSSQVRPAGVTGERGWQRWDVRGRTRLPQPPRPTHS